MPKCDVCGKSVKDITGGVMTYKHVKGFTGFTCGDCIEEREYKMISRSLRVTLLSTLLEEESKEREYDRMEI